MVLSMKENTTHTIKFKCWNYHIGELIPKIKCLCCNNVDITQNNFHCGHIRVRVEVVITMINNCFMSY